MLTPVSPQGLLWLALSGAVPAAAALPSAPRLHNLGLSAPLDTLIAHSAPPTVSVGARRIVTARMRAALTAFAQAPPPQSGIPPTTPPRIAPVATGGTRLNLDGLSAASHTGGAAGVDQYVQVSGKRLAIHDKLDGRPLLASFDADVLFGAGATAPCDGAAGVQFDQLAHRWIITQMARDQRRLCIAVSTTPDAASTYYRYALVFEDAVADAVGLSVWTDAYYASFAMFDAVSGDYLGPRVCALARNALLRGVDAALRCHNLGSGYGPVTAASLDGYARPAPTYLLSVDFTESGAGQRLFMWRMSAAGDSVSKATAIPVAPFAALGDRFSGRLAYRNDGGRESIVATHTVQQADGKPGLRWYELRLGDEGLQVYQQGTHTPDGDSRWQGAIAMDRMGNIALAYNAAGTDQAPGVRYTGRQRSGAPGRMDGEETVVNGGGVQIDEPGRLDGQGSLAPDPLDDCTFWSTQRYVPLTGRHTARTRIATFRFENCR